MTDFPGYGGFTGLVTCLNVDHHQATIFGTISAGSGAADPSTFPPSGTDPVYFVAVVNDQGKASAKKPSKDTMSFVGWDTEAGWALDPGIAVGDICGDPSSAISDTMFSLVGGDLSVVDK